MIVLGRNGKGEAVGSGFLYGDMFVTAAHNLTDAYCEDIYLVREERSIHLGRPVVIRLFDDAVFIRLTAKQQCDLHLASCSLRKTKLTTDERVFATTSSSIVGKPERTEGFVESTTAKHLVSYTGSTRGGFSGSPYCAGNTVLGMHLGGDKEKNTGYSAHILLARLEFEQRMRGFQNESSEDMFFKNFREGRYHDDDFLISRYSGSNEFEIEFQGRSHILTHQELSVLLKKRKRQTGRGITGVDFHMDYEDEDFVVESANTQVSEMEKLRVELAQLQGLIAQLVGKQVPKPNSTPLVATKLASALPVEPPLEVEKAEPFPIVDPENWIGADAVAAAPGRNSGPLEIVAGSSNTRPVEQVSPAQREREISDMIGLQLTPVVQNPVLQTMSLGLERQKKLIRRLVTENVERLLQNL